MSRFRGYRKTVEPGVLAHLKAAAHSRLFTVEEYATRSGQPMAIYLTGTTTPYGVLMPTTRRFFE